MASYGADTPKRHVCYSNSVQIKKLDKGRLQGWKRRSGKKVKTVEHYRDSTGKRRWKGTKALRATEFLGLIYIQICWGQWRSTFVVNPLSIGSYGLFKYICLRYNWFILGVCFGQVSKAGFGKVIGYSHLMVGTLVDMDSKPYIPPPSVSLPGSIRWGLPEKSWTWSSPWRLPAKVFLRFQLSYHQPSSHFQNLNGKLRRFGCF